MRDKEHNLRAKSLEFTDGNSSGVFAMPRFKIHYTPDFAVLIAQTKS